jgi:hypothetical protein
MRDMFDEQCELLSNRFSEVPNSNIRRGTAFILDQLELDDYTRMVPLSSQDRFAIRNIRRETLRKILGLESLSE